MTEFERLARHEASITAFWAEMGDSYAAWLAANPPVPGPAWSVPANDDLTAANDNVELKDAA